MSTVNAGCALQGTLYSSVWLCDAAGDVYVLKNLDSYVDRFITRLEFKTSLRESPSQFEQHPTPPPTPTPEWVKVDSGFSSVVAGFEGLVCGLKHSELYMRLGMSHKVPQGTSWTKVICEANQIAVGKDCIVRKTIVGNLFVANVRREYNLGTIGISSLPSWYPVSMCSLEELMSQQTDEWQSTAEPSMHTVIKFEHMLLDHKDRLFIVAPSGAVYGCLALFSEDNAKWIKVSQPPPIENPWSGIFHYISLLVGGGKKNEGIKEDTFSHVCVGKESLWCVKTDSCEVWHLSLSDFTTSQGVFQLRTNWSKVAIPAADGRATLLSASKSRGDGVYAVMVKNSNGSTSGLLVAFSLNQTSCNRVEIVLPSLCDPSSYKSLAIALDISLPSNNQHTHSHSPSLPRVDIVCCENGDCHFCRNAQVLYVPQLMLPNHQYPRTEEGQAFPSTSSILGKRPHPESVTEAQLAASCSSGISSSVGYYTPKRRRLGYPQLGERWSLLEGVQIQSKPPFTISDFDV